MFVLCAPSTQMTLVVLDEWSLGSLQKLNPAEGSRVEANYLALAECLHSSRLHLVFLAYERPKLLHVFQSPLVPRKSTEHAGSTQRPVGLFSLPTTDYLCLVEPSIFCSPDTRGSSRLGTLNVSHRLIMCRLQPAVSKRLYIV